MAHADRVGPAELPFEFADQVFEAEQRRGVVSTWSRHAALLHDRAVVSKDDRLDLRAAQVDTNSHNLSARSCRRAGAGRIAECSPEAATVRLSATERDRVVRLILLD